MTVRFPNVAQDIDTSETPPVIRYEEYRSLVAVANQRTDFCLMYHPRSVAIDPITNQIFVAEEFDRSRISIFSERGRFERILYHIDMTNPWGIAIHGNSIYVTDTKHHCVFQFKLSPPFRLVARTGGWGSAVGKFDVPNQLAVSTNGDVFVTDRDNDRVQILDSHLCYQRHISHHSLKKPYDVKLTNDQVFILSPYYAHCIHVFSHDGDKIRSFITRGSVNSGVKVCWPRFFCLDVNGNVIISDGEIKIFSKDGTFLQLLGQRGHELGMFDLLKGIALTNNQKLVVVSENRKYELQIFSF